MDAKHKKIRDQISESYKEIKFHNDRLDRLRKECDHPSSTEGNYSWRIGNIEKRMLCDVCDQPTDTPPWEPW